VIGSILNLAAEEQQVVAVGPKWEIEDACILECNSLPIKFTWFHSKAVARHIAM
jgi:hypothetical protein